MRAVIQRVKRAEVRVDGQRVGQVQPGAPGIVALIGVEDGDGPEDARWLADKIVGLRIFPDEDDKMNHDLVEAGGSLLVISQFTLLGDCRKGRRPSFVKAMAPDEADRLIQLLVARAKEKLPVETGVFQADMDVELVNDGPVTLLLDSKKQF